MAGVTSSTQTVLNISMLSQCFCQDLYADGHIAAVTSAELHTRVVSMVMIASNGPSLTWLGGVKKVNTPPPAPAHLSIKDTAV